MSFQDQAFGELEKNSDKFLLGTSSSENSQPAHLHELLCSLQKRLLAFCHINNISEVCDSLFFMDIYQDLETCVFGCAIISYLEYFTIIIKELFSPQNSSSVALLHKHLQLLLPHATDIYSRSANLLKESPWNGSVGEKLRDLFGVELPSNEQFKGNNY